jgi:hypothetical protein
MIGLKGGELHHNGMHWGSLLIYRKVRVPNWNAAIIRRLWPVHPLYRPRDNRAMFHGGMVNLKRMSTRNMWYSNRQQ